MKHIYKPEIHELLRKLHADDSASPPYSLRYETDTIKLLEGDTIGVLPSLQDGTIDFIFADPPYFLSSGGRTCSSGRSVSVDKGDWDKPMGLDAELDFTQQWIKECRRILKPNGTICISSTMHNLPVVGFSLRKLDFWALNDIVWRKPDPPPNLSRRYFTHSTETILWARRSKECRHFFDYKAGMELNGGQPLTSVITMPPPGYDEKRYGNHPTQKPVRLIELLIRVCTRPGDTVLDPFSGSGTTGVASLKLGRKYVGLEREPKYNEIAIKRFQSINRASDSMYLNR